MIVRAWTDRLRRKKTGQTIANQHNQQQQKQQRKSARSRMYTVHINTIVSSFCFLGSYSPHIFLFSSFSSMKKRVVIDIDLCSVVFYTQKEAGGVVSYASHVPERSASFSSDFPFLFFFTQYFPSSEEYKHIQNLGVALWNFRILFDMYAPVFLICGFAFFLPFLFFQSDINSFAPLELNLSVFVSMSVCVCVYPVYIIILPFIVSMCSSSPSAQSIFFCLSFFPPPHPR